MLENREIMEKTIRLFDKQWALLCAGTPDDFNMMTVSWGNIGVLWGKPVATVYVRPQRYTLGFLKKNPIFTLCFFPDSLHGVLVRMGALSGRDADKMHDSGLTPEETEHGFVAFAESILTLECRKLYEGKFREEEFLDRSILDANYPEKDLHHVFIGEILSIREK